jgi:hypothetical protein
MKDAIPETIAIPLVVPFRGLVMALRPYSGLRPAIARPEHGHNGRPIDVAVVVTAPLTRAPHDQASTHINATKILKRQGIGQLR